MQKETGIRAISGMVAISSLVRRLDGQVIVLNRVIDRTYHGFGVCEGALLGFVLIFIVNDSHQRALIVNLSLAVGE